MSLVMVHTDNNVIPAAKGFREETVRRDRTDGMDAFGICLGDRRTDLFNFFSAKKTIFTAMRIKTCYSYFGLFDAQFQTGLMCNFNDFKDTVFFYAVTCFSQDPPPLPGWRRRRWRRRAPPSACPGPRWRT